MCKVRVSCMGCFKPRNNPLPLCRVWIHCLVTTNINATVTSVASPYLESNHQGGQFWFVYYGTFQVSMRFSRMFPSPALNPVSVVISCDTPVSNMIHVFQPRKLRKLKYYLSITVADPGVGDSCPPPPPSPPQTHAGTNFLP